jgi:hypothetical protein
LWCRPVKILSSLDCSRYLTSLKLSPASVREPSMLGLVRVRVRCDFPVTTSCSGSVGCRVVRAAGTGQQQQWQRHRLRLNSQGLAFVGCKHSPYRAGCM